MKKEQFLILVDKYLSNTASKKEIFLVEKYYSELEKYEKKELENDEEEHIRELILSNINLQISENHSIDYETRTPRYGWLKIAATLLILCSISFLLYKKYDKLQTAIAYSDIKPGEDKAVLTLSNGQKVILGNEPSKKTITDGANISVINVSAGLLAYNKSSENSVADDKEFFNTIETPQGGRFKVLLSDGTVVWLNAKSSLKFPVAFKGKQRKVELIGEGYFEVAPNKNKLFVVSTIKQNVEVLGTHFNINAYDDEPSLKTTLLEGKILLKTKGTNKSNYLKPGDQAVLTGNNVNINKVDVLQAIDWKNDKFIFIEEDINSIMRKLSRWYNVDIEYAKPIDDLYFTGKLSRTKDMKEILTLISHTKDVKFDIKERRVMVYK